MSSLRNDAVPTLHPPPSSIGSPAVRSDILLSVSIKTEPEEPPSPSYPSEGDSMPLRVKTEPEESFLQTKLHVEAEPPDLPDPQESTELCSGQGDPCGVPMPEGTRSVATQAFSDLKEEYRSYESLVRCLTARLRRQALLIDELEAEVRKTEKKILDGTPKRKRRRLKV